MYSCVNDMQEVNATMQQHRDTEHGKDVELYYSEDGHTKIRIKAPVVTRYNDAEDPSTEFNEGLHVDFFDDTLGVTSQLTANYGIRHEKALQTIVRYNVIVINEKNEQLNTEELTWDEKRHTIYTDKQVIIKTATDTLRGTGFEADERMSRYKILKPMGTIRVEELNQTDSNATTHEDL